MVLKNVVDDFRFVFRGDREYLKGHLYMDASGSISEKVLDTVARMCAATEDLILCSHSHDTAVYPHVIGEPFKGGGGTSFDAIDLHVRTGEGLGGNEECPCDAPDDQPDFVIVVTDGEARPMMPENPELWVWIGVPGADLAWAEDYGMDVVQLTNDDLQAMAA
jgi:hypothetical protein